MSEYKDFVFFWEDGLKEAIEKSVLSAGWTIPTSKETNKAGTEEEVYQLRPINSMSGPSISLHLYLDVSDEELDKLDEIREQTRNDFHRVSKMRAKHGM